MEAVQSPVRLVATQTWKVQPKIFREVTFDKTEAIPLLGPMPDSEGVRNAIANAAK